METPQSLSPRSPMDNLESLDGSSSLPPRNTSIMGSSSTSSTGNNMPNGVGPSTSTSGPFVVGQSGPSPCPPPVAQRHHLPKSNNNSSSHHTPLVNGHGGHYSIPGGHPHPHPSHQPPPSSSHPGHNNNNNNNHVIINSPSAHPVPPPVPVLHPQPITISHSPSPSPATPNDVVMIGGSESTGSLISDRRVPIVPPRRCRTRSPTPNTSHGK